MRSPRPHLQDVVLVDVDADEADPTLPGAAPDGHPPGNRPRSERPGPRTRGRSAARRWWPLAVGLVLLLFVAANSAITARDERVRLAALAGVPGILAPLDGPVAEVWRSSLTSGSGLAASGGRLVGVDRGHDGQVDVVGLDPRTGETAWRVTARPPGPVDGWADCAVPEPAAPSAPGAKDAASAPVIACVVADKVVITAEDTAGYVFYPTAARLVVIETTTGALVSDGPVEPSTTLTALGADLVTSRIDDDGRAHLARTDARGTTERWTFVSPEPVPIDDTRQRVASVTVRDGLIVVDAGPTWVLSADGEVLDTWTPGASTELGGQVEVLRRGRLIAEPASGVNGRAPGTRIIDLATGDSFTATGHPPFLMVDDGSLADLVLLRSSASEVLTAYDVATGRARWTAPDSAGGGTAILDGRVLRTEAGELQAIDGGTGAVLWSTGIRQAAQSPLITDGRVVLLVDADAGRNPTLAAYGLDDGRLRWTTAASWDLYPFSLGRQLYGWTEQGLIRLD
ncbi:PQQ-binding-like beta-propeller repeat protein [Pengzhenrongella phosphoraccumulans]|uniref:outer membrane protein assembly factor BamB family protein n=1 Tax=Pengzhenrongella phosphoraccumulans TaxID=3114394 RepID=UPI00388D6F46